MLGNNINKIRIKKDIKLSALAKMVNISPGYLSDLEKGNKQNPSLDIINKIAEALNVPAEYLLKQSAKAIIEDRLEKKDMTFEDLSNLSNLSIAYFDKLDNITPDEIDYENMKKISTILGISSKELVEALSHQEPQVFEGTKSNPIDDFKEDTIENISAFDTPQKAMQFILRQPSIMGFGGFDVDKMSDEEIVDFANELLNQMKLISYKYKK